MSNTIIKCRAKLNGECYDGNEEEGRVNPDQSWTDDITYREEDNTCVCDSCYILLIPLLTHDRGLRMDVDNAIEAWRSDEYTRPRDVKAVSFEDDPDPNSRISILSKKAIELIRASDAYQEGDRIIVMLSCQDADDPARINAGIGINGYSSQLDLFDDITSHLRAIAEAVGNA